MRSVGLSVVSHDGEGVLSWPRIAAKCEFRSAARFEDVLQIEVRIARLGVKSITYAHRFSREGQEVAAGEVTAVCCRMNENAPPQSLPIPGWIAEKLQAFVSA